MLAPAGVLTAVLYYFGYVREQALFAYFGIDLGSLDFSTTDYLVRSAGTLFLPLATLLVGAVVAVASHYVLLHLLGRATLRWRRIAWIALAAIATTMLLLGAIGLHRRHDPFLSPLAAPVALGTGALLLEYAVETARATERLPAPLRTALDGTGTLRRVLAAALLLVAVFWATANVAQQRGIAAARAIELTLSTHPQAVVYSRVRLQITGPGVNLEPLGAAGAAFAFRYNGLRMLVHTGGRWFLLPVGWTHDNGATVILLPDTSGDIRVDLAP
ncbi:MULTISPECIES: hypothetical protein [Kribbella]|uniref:hypothetical protein n=1 Tax=Kribbella TaxID=182639 RepID=UPI0010509792|nr:MULTISPECIES: hypothetical protein [Kribbella]